MYFDVAFALISILSCYLFLGCSQNLSVFPGYDSSVTGTSVLLSREKEDRTGFPFYRKSVSKICFSEEKTSRRSLVHWVCDPNREIAGGQFCLTTHCDLVVLDPLHFRKRYDFLPSFVSLYFLYFRIFVSDSLHLRERETEREREI